MNRIKNGLRLLRQSATVVWKHPSMIAVIAIGFVAQFGVFIGLFLAAFQGAPAPSDLRSPRILWAFPILAASGIVGSLASATVIATAMQQLETGHARLRDGFRLAVRRFPALVGWTFFTATVGVVIQLISERVRPLGHLIAAIGGVAWAVVTMLVVPALLFEDLGVMDSIKRSASLIKSRWGEGVTGAASLGLGMIIVTMPILVVGVAVAGVSPLASMILMGSWFFLTLLVAGTLGGVFNAALYRFAAEGEVSAPFGREQLETAFQTKEEAKRSPWWRAARIAGIVLSLAYLAVLILRWVTDGGP